MRGCHVGVWGWSLQCPPFNLAILPGQKRRVKNDAFSPFISFWGLCATWCYGMGVFMVSRRSWGDFQAACRFDSSVVGRLVVWSTEESHPINRESSPCGWIFHSASLFI